MNTKRYYAPIFYIIFLLSGCASTQTPDDNATNASDINTLINESMTHALRGDTAQAEINIREALNINSENVNANNIAGLVYSYANKPHLATAHFKKALAVAPNDASTLNNYGNFLCDTSKFTQAEQVFLRAATNPNNTNPEIAYTNAGLCSIRALDQDKAANYFVTAIGFREENAVAYFHLAQINLNKGLGKPALERIQSYARFAKHTPQSLKLGIEIGRLLEDSEIENDYLIKLQTDFPSSEEYTWAISQ